VSDQAAILAELTLSAMTGNGGTELKAWPLPSKGTFSTLKAGITGNIADTTLPTWLRPATMFKFQDISRWLFQR